MSSIQGYHVMGPDFVHGPEHGRGHEPRDFRSFPLGFMAPVGTRPMFDPSEFKDRIAQKTAQKTWIKDLCDQAGLGVKNQSQSNYCWAHAPTHAVEVNRVLQGDPALALAAFYTAYQTTGGSNQGGSGIVAVKTLADHGTCTEKLWAPMTFRESVTADIQASAAKHKVVLWEDMDPRNHQAIISSILSDQPITVGIPAWSHEILITFLVWDPTYSWNYGGVGYGFDNSWGSSYGTNGRGILSRSYSSFDEAGCLISSSSSVD